jgi:hypothetical protein
MASNAMGCSSISSVSVVYPKARSIAMCSSGATVGGADLGSWSMVISCFLSHASYGFLRASAPLYSSSLIMRPCHENQ